MAFGGINQMLLSGEKNFWFNGSFESEKAVIWHSDVRHTRSRGSASV